ncbi:MAG: DUF805 domain-containing protein [Litorimonas sp.]
MKSILRLMLSPSGRIGRKGFWLGFAGLTAFCLVLNVLLGQVTEQGALEFWLGLGGFFLFFQIFYAVYGKRLHDMGRTFWPITACFFGTILILIAGMLIFGGAEYFSEFSQYDRKDIIDPSRRDAITEAFKPKLSRSEAVLGPILSGLWLGFTLWVGVSKSEPKENNYGPSS